jgi:hypothetical protein
MIGHIGTITPRIHPNCTTYAPGDCAQERQIAPLIRRTPRYVGIKARCACDDQIVLKCNIIKTTPKAYHYAAQAPIPNYQVAAYTHGENRDIRRKRTQKISQIIPVRGLKEKIRRPTHAQPS